MKLITSKSSLIQAVLGFSLALIFLGGCDRNDGELSLDDLTVGERNFIDKIVSVERALAVSYIHREAGNTLLDSLAADWGDSVSTAVMAQLPTDPKRTTKVDELLLRLITAEQDSFKLQPGANRLDLPLPNLNRPSVVAVPNEPGADN